MKRRPYLIAGVTIALIVVLVFGGRAAWLFGPSWVSLLDYLDDAVTVLTALAVAVGLIVLLVRLLRPTPPVAQPVRPKSEGDSDACPRHPHVGGA
jgi:hypothetical protein